MLALLAAQVIEAQQQPPRDSTLQAQVAYLMDRQAITDTLQRYIRGIDRHDKELARSAFWPEARINLGTPMGREEYVEHEEGVLATYASHQHHITGQTVDIQGNTAHVESYVFFSLCLVTAAQMRPGALRQVMPSSARKRKWAAADTSSDGRNETASGRFSCVSTCTI